MKEYPQYMLGFLAMLAQSKQPITDAELNSLDAHARRYAATRRRVAERRAKARKAASLALERVQARLAKLDAADARDIAEQAKNKQIEKRIAAIKNNLKKPQ